MQTLGRNFVKFCHTGTVINHEMMLQLHCLPSIVETQISSCNIQVVNIWQPPQLSGSICIYHPPYPGYDPKAQHLRFFNLYLCDEKRTKINMRFAIKKCRRLVITQLLGVLGNTSSHPGKMKPPKTIQNLIQKLINNYHILISTRNGSRHQGSLTQKANKVRVIF